MHPKGHTVTTRTGVLAGLVLMLVPLAVRADGPVRSGFRVSIRYAATTRTNTGVPVRLRRMNQG